MASQLNLLLDQLGKWEPGLSSRRLRPISFSRGDVLGQAGRPIEDVYFPDSGMVSVVVELDSGDRVEAAVVSHKGGFGLGAAFGDTVHLNTGVVQISGSAMMMSPGDLREIADNNPQARNFLFAHQQFMLAQSQQSAACNAKHHIPERLSNWLLRVRDATGRKEFELTQEFVADMLGVQRPSVSIVASQLQELGLIAYKRGRISIENEAGLMEHACECYRTLQDQERRIFDNER